MFSGQHPFPGQNGQVSPIACSGVSKQVSHRRPDEPFFTLGSNVHDYGGGEGMAKKWSILDQKWPNMASLSTLQSNPKGSKKDQMVNISVFFTIVHPFGHTGSLLDQFKPKMIFCSEAPPPNSTLFLSEYNFQDDGHK